MFLVISVSKSSSGPSELWMYKVIITTATAKRERRTIVILEIAILQIIAVHKIYQKYNLWDQGKIYRIPSKYILSMIAISACLIRILSLCSSPPSPLERWQDEIMQRSISLFFKHKHDLQRTFRLLDTEHTGQLELIEFREGLEAFNNHLNQPLSELQIKQLCKAIIESGKEKERRIQMENDSTSSNDSRNPLISSSDIPSYSSYDQHTLINYEEFLDSFYLVDQNATQQPLQQSNNIKNHETDNISTTKQQLAVLPNPNNTTTTSTKHHHPHHHSSSKGHKEGSSKHSSKHHSSHKSKSSSSSRKDQKKEVQ